MRKKEAGLSLIEVTIASIILVVVVGIAFSIMFAGTTAVERSQITHSLEQRGRQVTNLLAGDFITARFKLDYSNAVAALQNSNPYTITGVGGPIDLGIYSNNTEIRYMIDGNRDQNGVGPPTVGAPIKNGQIVWGYTSPLSGANGGFRKDLACLIRFEAQTVLLESSSSTPVPSQPASWGSPFPPLPTLQTVVLNMDVDKNGSRSDTFVVGKLKRYIAAPQGHPLLGAYNNPLSVETLDDNVILKVVGGAFNGDMDPAIPGSGILFNFIDKTGAAAMAGNNPAPTATAVSFTLWHGSVDDRIKDYWLRVSHETIHFRNSQN